MNPPRAQIKSKEIVLVYERVDHNVEALKAEYERTVGSINQCLNWQRVSADEFNRGLENLVRSCLTVRKERLLQNANMTAALGLPMKRREDIPTTYSVPLRRAVARVDRVKASAPFQPEPQLSNEDYDHILRVLRNMVRVMECSPHAFATMGEEDIRTQFLVQLNAQYEGQASAETFNFQGKTDILLKVDGKNAFIAECKFWKGEKSFAESIDQLLSYLSWRDTKTAILIFNRNTNFTGVLQKVAEAAPKHPRFKRDLRMSDETSFRYVFGQPNDSNREVTLTVLAFDVPGVEARPKAMAAGA